jgi:hypothetical protein
VRELNSHRRTSEPRVEHAQRACNETGMSRSVRHRPAPLAPRGSYWTDGLCREIAISGRELAAPGRNGTRQIAPRTREIAALPIQVRLM